MTSQPSSQPPFNSIRPSGPTAGDRLDPPPGSSSSRSAAPGLSAVRSGAADLAATGLAEPVSGRTAAVRRWMREWQTWQDRPGTEAALVRWQRHTCLAELAVPPGPTGLETVLAACGRDVSVAREVADVRLAAVVAEALRGDQVATRLVLQRVFPALTQRAAARARLHQLAFGAVLDDLMAQAWLVICEYPLQARPAKIAVNVIRDAEYRLFGYVPITHRNTLPLPPEDLPAAGGPVGSAASGEPERVLSELPVMLLDEVSAGFPVQDARLLTQLYLFGLSTAEIAEAEQVSPRWVRRRKQRALRRLAAHLGYPPPPEDTPRPRTTRASRTDTTSTAATTATSGSTTRARTAGPTVRVPSRSEDGRRPSAHVPAGDAA